MFQYDPRVFPASSTSKKFEGGYAQSLVAVVSAQCSASIVQEAHTSSVESSVCFCVRTLTTKLVKWRMSVELGVATAHVTISPSTRCDLVNVLCMQNCCRLRPNAICGSPVLPRCDSRMDADPLQNIQAWHSHLHMKLDLAAKLDSP